MCSVAVVLTSFRRPQLLPIQLKAVRDQEECGTIRVIVWHNRTADTEPNEKTIRQADDFIYSSRNLGVWARFLPLLHETAPYLAVIDDDTIPGPLWFKTAIETLDRIPGVVGPFGVTFPKGARSPRKYHQQADHAQDVDIIGHSWLFRKGLLHMWLRDYLAGGPYCGEDYALSVAAQKMGFHSTVPPLNGQRTNGNLDNSLGVDNAALYLTEGAEEEKRLAHNHFLIHGWKPLSMAARFLPGQKVLPRTETA